MPELLDAPDQGETSSAVWGEVPRPQRMSGGEIAIESPVGRATTRRSRAYIVSVTEARPSQPAWFGSAMDTLLRLVALPQNWDSYGARPLDRRAVNATLAALSELVGGNVPLPSIVPTSSGWIQLEWHRPGVDLEVELLSPSSAKLYYFDERTGAGREETLHGRFDAAAKLLAEVFSS
jgi:hypothetical protein